MYENYHKETLTTRRGYMKEDNLFRTSVNETFVLYNFAGREKPKKGDNIFALISYFPEYWIIHNWVYDTERKGVVYDESEFWYDEWLGC